MDKNLTNGYTADNKHSFGRRTGKCPAEKKRFKAEERFLQK
jgi:hypothetical protein